jgi:phosphoribosylglycinamide formyltransferase 1
LEKNKKIAILISGRGSNMVALADAIATNKVPNASIAVVVSDKPAAPGLQLASGRGLPTAVVERHGKTRENHEREIISLLQSHRVDLICLAGYMRLLSPCFIDAFRGRILNIHPSLLPAFPGLDAHHQALTHGVKVSGCTVHFVDDTLDGGPIIAQRVVPVLDDDTEETLSARVLEQEHELYAEALRVVVEGHYEVVGRRVVVR